MFLCDIRDTFVDILRARVRNGEMTERGLAKLVGVSQPHVHHILKGKRQLTPEMMDRCLYQLRMSVLDLIDRATLAHYLDRERREAGEYSWLPVLAGRIGPAFAWPTEVEHHAAFPIRSAVIRSMWHPVVVKAGFDVRMHPILSEGDMLLLNQSHRARIEIDPHALYVIKRGRIGMVRRLRTFGGQVYLVTEDTLEQPGLWETLPADGIPMLHFVRARALLLPPEHEWTQPRAKDL